jgi:hypothetical protein
VKLLQRQPLVICFDLPVCCLLGSCSGLHRVERTRLLQPNTTGNCQGNKSWAFCETAELSAHVHEA